ncbi:hypothetical protein MRX96_004362 [Rhipicephalus microplus]
MVNSVLIAHVCVERRNPHHHHGKVCGSWEFMISSAVAVGSEPTLGSSGHFGNDDDDSGLIARSTRTRLRNTGSALKNSPCHGMLHQEDQSSDESSLREPERQAAKEDVSLKDEADAEQPEGEDAIAKNEGSSSSTSSKKIKDNKASKARGSSKKKGSSKAPRGEQVSQAGSSKESKM